MGSIETIIKEELNMSEVEYQSQIGGRFLIEEIGTNPVFSRENFSDEHKEIDHEKRDISSTWWFYW